MYFSLYSSKLLLRVSQFSFLPRTNSLFFDFDIFCVLLFEFFDTTSLYFPCFLELKIFEYQASFWWQSLMVLRKCKLQIIDFSFSAIQILIIWIFRRPQMELVFKLLNFCCGKYLCYDFTFSFHPCRFGFLSLSQLTHAISFVWSLLLLFSHCTQLLGCNFEFEFVNSLSLSPPLFFDYICGGCRSCSVYTIFDSLITLLSFVDYSFLFQISKEVNFLNFACLLSNNTQHYFLCNIFYIFPSSSLFFRCFLSQVGYCSKNVKFHWANIIFSSKMHIFIFLSRFFQTHSFQALQKFH